MSGYTFARCSHDEYKKATENYTATSAEPVSFLQAPFYGAMQTASGKDVLYFTIHRDDTLVGFGLGVIYNAPGGLRFLYFPYGPVCADWDDALAQALEAFIRPIANELGCSFVRMDSLNQYDGTNLRPVSAKLARTASLQPRAEWVLDITKQEEELWMAMHKHARYNVRLAERANAKTVLYSPDEAPLDEFFALMQTTAGRDDFGIYSRDYYGAYLGALSAQDCFMLVTYIDDRPAAAGLFVTYAQQTHYVFAGSSNDFRKIAPAYTVIWEAVKESQKRDCTHFNFGGIIDSVKSQDLGGVTSFKKRFGGYEVTHQNPYDIVVKTLPYLAFKLYKSLR